MSQVAKLARGAGWTYGAQLATIAAQFAYAAVTSRALAPGEFGVYAVALTVSGFFGLMANAGLAQSVARLVDDEMDHIGSLWVAAWVLAASYAVLAVVTAPALAGLWGVPEAAPVIQVLALSNFAGPIIGVAGGILRRQGRFKYLSLRTVFANLFGMVVGATLVLHLRTPESLTASMVTAQLVTAALAVWGARKELAFAAPWRALSSMRFAANASASSFAQYVNGNLVRFFAANTLPPSSIGQWNRAEVLGSMPFQQLQSALLPVVYPEFRHDRTNASRTRDAWTDMLCVLSWVTFPLAGVAAGLLPELMPLILGQQWGPAGQYAVPLAIAGGLQPVVMLLASALEAVGAFRAIWWSNVLQFVTQVVVAFLLIRTSSIWPALFSLMASMVVCHVVLGLYAARTHRLHLRRVGSHYLGAAASGAILALLANRGASAAFDGAYPQMGMIAFVVVAIAAVCLRWREHLPPVKVLRRRVPLRTP